MLRLELGSPHVADLIAAETRTTANRRRLRHVVTLSLFFLWRRSRARVAQFTADLRTIHDQILWTLRHDDADKASRTSTAPWPGCGREPGMDLAAQSTEAQILLYKSELSRSSFRAERPLPASLVSTDIAVRKAMMEGIAHRQAQQFAESRET